MKPLVELWVITITRNDSVGLKRTLDSFKSLDPRPDGHLIVDGSDLDTARKNRALASKTGVSYVWTEPTGIYAAMNFALSQTSPTAYVWFVNGGDEVSCEQAVSLIRRALVGFAPPWLIGGVCLVGHGSVRRYLPAEIYADGESYIRGITQGTAWFPHPATVMRASDLLLVGGFSERLRISADYKALLATARLVGPPTLLNACLATHYSAGVSSEHPYLARLENSWSRLRILGLVALPREIYWTARLLLRFAVDQRHKFAQLPS